MIRVENLTKRYGSITAIQDVSFEVNKGEVLGFLGPNGAGKTTTMRILSGFFPASEGTAVVAGFDVFERSLEVKKRVGYLPENPPLYPEMTVDTYLRFVASIKGVDGPKVNSRLTDVKVRCGLYGQGDRLIKHLSKGYRQRVGLAQSLIHEPEVKVRPNDLPSSHPYRFLSPVTVRQEGNRPKDRLDYRPCRFLCTITVRWGSNGPKVHLTYRPCSYL